MVALQMLNQFVWRLMDQYFQHIETRLRLEVCWELSYPPTNIALLLCYVHIAYYSHCTCLLAVRIMRILSTYAASS